MAALTLTAASLLATPAFSADMPLLRGSVVPSYRWEGLYVGGHVGYGVQSSDFTLARFPEATFTALAPPIPTATSAHADGFIGGIQGGYLKQFGALVVGFEQDLIWAMPAATAQSSGSVNGGILGPVPFSLTQTQQVQWLATTRARIGFSPDDWYMVYATGGLAVGGVKTSTNLTYLWPGTAIYDGLRDDYRVGWAAGVGVEYALDAQISATLEYLHFDLGHAGVVGFQGGPFPFETHTGASISGDILRGGVNYRFERDGYAVRALGPQASSLATEIGLRYWYSTATTAKDLFGAPNELVSRLTYDGLRTSSGEIFLRSDDFGASRLFIKGFIGAGAIGSGSLKDEDFPPGISPYSATNSAQRDGTLFYASGDFGWNFYTAPTYKLGAFAGAFFEREVVNAFGCAQIAGNPLVCEPPISSATLGITEDARWAAVRLGLSGEVMLWNCLKLNGDVAWLPLTMLSGADSHWLRMQPAPGNFDGAVPEDGSSNTGVQLEGVISYLVSPDFNVGVGARYWRLESNGNANFTVFGSDGGAQPVHFVTERYGGFVQGAFRF
jgi:opacity protein-like surface antigen